MRQAPGHKRARQTDTARTRILTLTLNLTMASFGRGRHLQWRQGGQAEWTTSCGLCAAAKARLDDSETEKAELIKNFAPQSRKKFLPVNWLETTAT